MDFDNSFVNGLLKREVYFELPKHIYKEIVRRKNIMRLKESLYRCATSHRLPLRILIIIERTPIPNENTVTDVTRKLFCLECFEQNI